MTIRQFFSNLFRSDGYRDGNLEVLYSLKSLGNVHGLTHESIVYMVSTARKDGHSDLAISIGIGVDIETIKAIPHRRNP